MSCRMFRRPRSHACNAYLDALADFRDITSLIVPDSISTHTQVGDAEVSSRGESHVPLIRLSRRALLRLAPGVRDTHSRTRFSRTSLYVHIAYTHTRVCAGVHGNTQEGIHAFGTRLQFLPAYRRQDNYHGDMLELFNLRKLHLRVLLANVRLPRVSSSRRAYHFYLSEQIQSLFPPVASG